MAVPAITSVSPEGGAITAVTNVLITGTNLGSATLVELKTTPATSLTILSNTATQIVVQVPMGLTRGLYHLEVTTAGGTSSNVDADRFAVLPKTTFVKDPNALFGDFIDAAGNATQVSLAADGSIPVDATFSGDIEIGAVEIKNGATDDRAIVATASDATADGLALYTSALSYQPTAANLNAQVAQPTASNLKSEVSQPTASNLNANVSQPTAANLNATVTGSVTALSGTAADLLALVSQPTAANLQSEVYQATASNLNATVTGTVDIGTLPTVTVTGTVDIGTMPDVNIATLPDVNIATLPTVTVTGTVDVGTLPDVNIATLPTVTVTGTVDIGTLPSVDISTLPDINIATLPTVTVANDTAADLLALVSQPTASELNATVTGTVDIGTMPSIDISTLPDINIATLPTVTVTGTVDVGTLPDVNIATLPTVTVTGSVTAAPNRTVTVTSDTGSAAINKSTALAANFRLSSVTLHASGGMANENLTISIDANDGAEYDAILFTINTSGVTDICFTPDNDLLFESGDEIVVSCTNTNSVNYGLRIVTEVI